MPKLPDVSSYAAIKSVQRKELLFIFYYLIYFLDLVKGMCYTWDIETARKSVRFEKEARQKDGTQQYLRLRKRFSWKKF